MDWGGPELCRHQIDALAHSQVEKKDHTNLEHVSSPQCRITTAVTKGGTRSGLCEEPGLDGDIN